MKKICSACLLGKKCRFDGQASPVEKLIKNKKDLIPVCPEELGGLATPREAVELTSDGTWVLLGAGKAMTKKGADLTDNFIKGAKEVLSIAEKNGIKEAILKQKSPSCGFGKIYDGTFSGKIIKGNGILAALLKSEGFKIKTEEDL